MQNRTMALPVEIWKIALALLDVVNQCRMLQCAKNLVPEEVEATILRHYRRLFRAGICDMGVMADVTAEGSQRMAQLLLAARAGRRLHRYVLQPLMRLNVLRLTYPGVDGHCETSVRIIGHSGLSLSLAGCLDWASRGRPLEQHGLPQHLHYDPDHDNNLLFAFENLNNHHAVVVAAAQLLRHAYWKYSLHGLQGHVDPSVAILEFRAFGMHGVLVARSI